MTRFQVHVVPRSVRTAADGRHGGLPRLRLRAVPADGRANAEAERVLSELLRARVTLVSGARSRRKTFEVGLPEAVLEAKLTAAFG